MSRYPSIQDIPDDPDRTRLAQLLDDLEQAEEQAEGCADVQALDQALDRQWAIVTQVGALVPTVTISVADGRAVYAVEAQDSNWAILCWIYGGPDGYVSPFGERVAIPVETARRMVQANEAMRRLFPGPEEVM